MKAVIASENLDEPVTERDNHTNGQNEDIGDLNDSKWSRMSILPEDAMKMMLERDDDNDATKQLSTMEDRAHEADQYNDAFTRPINNMFNAITHLPADPQEPEMPFLCPAFMSHLQSGGFFDQSSGAEKAESFSKLCRSYIQTRHMNKNIANRPAAEEVDSVVFWMSFLHFGVGTMGFFNHMGRGTHGFAHGRHVAMTRLKDMLSYVKATGKSAATSEADMALHDYISVLIT